VQIQASDSASDERGTGSTEFEASLKAAGVESNTKILLGLVGVALVIFLAIVFRSQPEPVPPPPPPPPPPAPVAIVKTPTVAEIPPAPELKKEKKRRRKKYSLSNPPPVVGPGSDERLRQAERNLANGELESAAEKLAILRKKLPRDSAVWVLSGMLADEQGDMELALKHALHALRVNRADYRAWVLKGVLEQTSDNVVSAETSYRKALELEPSHPMRPELRVVLKGLEQ